MIAKAVRDVELAVQRGKVGPSTRTTFQVVAPSTGCHNGAGWCLHDVLITHRPHDPSTFDLARDYTDFASRPITMSKCP